MEWLGTRILVGLIPLRMGKKYHFKYEDDIFEGETSRSEKRRKEVLMR